MWAAQTKKKQPKSSKKLVLSSIHDDIFAFYFSSETSIFQCCCCVTLLLNLICGRIFEEGNMEEGSSLFWTVFRTGRPFSGDVFLKGFLCSSCVLPPPPTCNLMCSGWHWLHETCFYPPFSLSFCHLLRQCIFCSKSLRNDVIFAGKMGVLFFSSSPPLPPSPSVRSGCSHGPGISVWHDLCFLVILILSS